MNGKSRQSLEEISQTPELKHKKIKIEKENIKDLGEGQVRI